MSVIVTDKGFHKENWDKGFIPWDQATETNWHRAAGYALDLPNTASADQVLPFFPFVEMIRIAFPSSADGRGFSIARHLRQLGFEGRLRAFGHVLADQYTMARRSGFDEVEIDDALATRQPEDQWLFRSDWKAHDYQARLRAGL
ncbi:MAG: DUF934 domain-containing protein [Pseudomonadota bacterium]